DAGKLLDRRGVSRPEAGPDAHVAFPRGMRPREILLRVSHRTSMPGLVGRGATEVAYNLAVEVRGWIRAALPRQPLNANLSVDVAPDDWGQLAELLRPKEFHGANILDSICAAIKEQTFQAVESLESLSHAAGGSAAESSGPERKAPLHTDGDVNN